MSFVSFESNKARVMFLIIICIALLVWYSIFRYKRRRLYELSEAFHSPLHLNKLFGLLRYTFDGVNVSFPLIKEVSEYAHSSGGILKLWVGPILYIVPIKRMDVEYIFKKFVDKDTVESFIRYVLGDASIFGPVDIWVRRRKMLVPAFSPKIVNSFVDIVVERSEVLTKQLIKDDRVGTGHFSVWPYINAYTLAAVAETSLGVKVDAQINPDLPFLKAVSQTLLMCTRVMFSVWLWPYWVYKLTPTYREVKRCRVILYNLTDKIIQERREALKDVDMKEYNNSIFGQGPDKVKSFLDHLILQSEDNKVTDIELREEMLILLLAGTDTSAVAICNTLKLLAKYPKVQDKVYAELMELFKNSDRRIERDDLKEAHYLYRVIKESLRLFPPVPLVGRKINKETLLPSGAILPKGSDVVVPVWGVHRDPNAWGPTADCFDPDRFLSEDEGLFMPFSIGPRNCIGYQYALIAVKIALIAILRKYRVTGDEESGPKPHIDCQYSVMLRDKEGYQICLELR